MHFSQTKFSIKYIIIPTIAIGIFASVLVSVTGCTSIEPVNTETSGYVSAEALPAHEYAAYIANELNTVMAQTTTRLTTMDRIIRQEYDYELELKNVEQSINIIKSCEDVIVTTRPAKTYDEDMLLAKMHCDEILFILNDYKTKLENKDTDYTELFNKLKAERESMSALIMSAYK